LWDSRFPSITTSAPRHCPVLPFLAPIGLRSAIVLSETIVTIIGPAKCGLPNARTTIGRDGAVKLVVDTG